MQTFLIVQTALNLFAACASKDPFGRFICLAFGLWGAAAWLLNFFH